MAETESIKRMRVRGLGTRYGVSADGRVWTYFSKSGWKLRKTQDDRNGYQHIMLRVEGKNKRFFIHRLVAGAFIGVIPEGYQVNHLDGNKKNNQVSNLEICTPAENHRHAREVLGLQIGIACVPVMKFSLGGEFIQEYPSISEAARDVDTSPSSITAACIGDSWKSCGFQWRYSSNDEEELSDYRPLSDLSENVYV